MSPNECHPPSFHMHNLSLFPCVPSSPFHCYLFRHTSFPSTSLLCLKTSKTHDHPRCLPWNATWSHHDLPPLWFSLSFFFFCFQYSSICFNGFYHKQNSPLDYFTISHDSPPCNVLPSLINSFFKTQFKWHRYFLFLVTLNLFCDHSLLIPPQML